MHARAANLVRNLLTSHDWDPRYSDYSCKARVATLYLPLVGVLLDALPHLYDWNSENKGMLTIAVSLSLVRCAEIVTVPHYEALFTRD